MTTQEPAQFLMPILETPSHVVAAPAAPYGYSKYLYGVVNSVVSSLNSFISNSNANDLQTRTELGKAFDDRAAIRTELSAEVDTLDARIIQKETEAISARDALKNDLEAADVSLNSRVDELYQWRENNTDEIATEVDKAINLKVDDTLFQSVKTALEAEDSALGASISQAITDREGKDAQHDGQLEKLEHFVKMMMETYTLTDASGNVISTVGDIVVPTTA